MQTVWENCQIVYCTVCTALASFETLWDSPELPGNVAVLLERLRARGIFLVRADLLRVWESLDAIPCRTQRRAHPVLGMLTLVEEASQTSRSQAGEGVQAVEITTCWKSYRLPIGSRLRVCRGSAGTFPWGSSSHHPQKSHGISGRPCSGEANHIRPSGKPSPAN